MNQWKISIAGIAALLGAGLLIGSVPAARAQQDFGPYNQFIYGVVDPALRGQIPPVQFMPEPVRRAVAFGQWLDRGIIENNPVTPLARAIAQRRFSATPPRTEAELNDRLLILSARRILAMQQRDYGKANDLIGYAGQMCDRFDREEWAAARTPAERQQILLRRLQRWNAAMDFAGQIARDNRRRTEKDLDWAETQRLFQQHMRDVERRNEQYWRWGVAP